MIDEQLLLNLDQQYLWHPCSQMKDYETFPPIIINKAFGCYLELSNGKKIIDAISSWWCKSLGHQHPQLKKALYKQLEKFEHVLLANTTNSIIVSLSQKLAQLLPGLTKVSYASDGSCAIEMAIKMSLQSRQILGEKQKNKFICLENSYHGETIGALSVSDLGLYAKPFKPILFSTPTLGPLPYVTTMHDLLWHDCSQYWPVIEKKLMAHAHQTTAIIVEPIVQGAGGMKIYSKDFLKRLRKWSKNHQIHLIVDEMMTGFGRTGKMLACEHADIIPDFLCLGKGLTSGWLPLSALITHDDIYNIFYDDYTSDKSFLHSHTYSGNVLAASIALEVLNIFNEEKICQQAAQLGEMMLEAMYDIANSSKKITNVRGIGAIVAADLICDYPNQRLGYRVFQSAMEKGALLRPLGNTIYWLPPLIMQKETLNELKNITQDAVTAQ